MLNVERSDIFDCVGPGWTPLLTWLEERLSPEVKILQVKEKFGGLRFYIDSEDKKDHTLVSFAERASYLICEQCGTTVDVNTEGSWRKTLCKGCRSSGW